MDSLGNAVERYQQGMTIDGIEGRQLGQSSLSDRYIKDHLGSVRKVIDSSGSVFNSYDYDSFGRPIDFTETIPSHFHFTGREFDQESGLYYYRARYYDSNTGRFLSEDPIGFLGGLNFYGYGRNNLIVFVDPSGMLKKECVKCPSGIWSGTGGSLGGMFIGGVFTGIYKVTCWDSINSCWIISTCKGFGLGIGGGLGIESFWVWNAYSAKELEGLSYGNVLFGGKGIIGLSATYSPRGPHNVKYFSSSSSVSYGAGIGIGGGFLISGCEITVLSCN